MSLRAPRFDIARRLVPTSRLCCEGNFCEAGNVPRTFGACYMGQQRLYRVAHHMSYGSVPERGAAAGAAPRPRPARHAVLLFAALGAAAAAVLRGRSRAPPSSLDAAPPATAAGAASSAPLTYTVSNEYGELSNHTLSLYGYSHVFEPYKTSSVAIVDDGGDDGGGERVRWLITQADGSLALDAEGRNATLQCTVVGALNVTLLEADSPAASGAWAVRGRDLGAACLYVRRELRTLTRDDLARFVGALRAVYETPAGEGRAKYGPDFHTGLGAHGRVGDEAEAPLLSGTGPTSTRGSRSPRSTRRACGRTTLAASSSRRTPRTSSTSSRRCARSTRASRTRTGTSSRTPAASGRTRPSSPTSTLGPCARARTTTLSCGAARSPSCRRRGTRAAPSSRTRTRTCSAS